MLSFISRRKPSTYALIQRILWQLTLEVHNGKEFKENLGRSKGKAQISQHCTLKISFCYIILLQSRKVGTINNLFITEQAPLIKQTYLSTTEIKKSKHANL